MPDSLGWRANWGVVVPSTNTSVQPEFDEMRPRGVTNHIVRIWIPNDPVGSNADFNRLMENIRLEWDNALLRVMTCNPDYLLMGMSSETFWGGLQRSLELKKHMMELTGRDVAMGSDACQAALRCYGDIKRIGVLTPYWPVADENVTKFLEDCGFEVVVIKGLCCDSPTAMSQVTEKELRDALLELNEHDVEAPGPVRHQPRDGAAGWRGRKMAEEAGHRHQHRHLLVRHAGQRDGRHCPGLRLPDDRLQGAPRQLPEGRRRASRRRRHLATVKLAVQRP